MFAEKSQSIDTLEMFINEVEKITREREREVKIVISNRDCEYYRKYNETPQVQPLRSNGSCHIECKAC